MSDDDRDNKPDKTVERLKAMLPSYPRLIVTSELRAFREASLGFFDNSTTTGLLDHVAIPLAVTRDALAKELDRVTEERDTARLLVHAMRAALVAGLRAKSFVPIREMIGAIDKWKQLHAKADDIEKGEKPS